jgi:hypothetical protein
MTSLVTVMDTIYALLHEDATLITYLGAANVSIGWVNQDSVFPCVTVFGGSESSNPKFGYDFSGNRDNAPSVQIDVWIDKSHVAPLPSTSRDLSVIADYVDKLIFAAHVTGTSGWRRNSYPEQQENSVLTTLFHKTMTYQFEYKTQDV